MKKYRSLAIGARKDRHGQLVAMGKYLYCRFQRIHADISPSPVIRPGMGKYLRRRAFNERCRYFLNAGPMSWYEEVSVLSDTTDSCSQRYRHILIPGAASGYGEVSVPLVTMDSCRYFPIPGPLPGVTHKFVFLIKLESGTLSKHTMVDRLLQF